ncbi:MAG: hypothetical protein KatS3mg118_1499 [Paracoccaceae bacterium]|nr:MAG: hypothetical protein KatS3mg118_1499 [Paracoccaceae bacterium]
MAPLERIATQIRHAGGGMADTLSAAALCVIVMILLGLG